LNDHHRNNVHIIKT